MSTLLWDLVLKSFAIAACGLGLTMLMRKSSAATRHFTLTLTLVGLLALPVASVLLPRWQVPFLQVKVDAPAARQSSTQTPPSTLSTESAKSTPAQTPSAPQLPILLWSSLAVLLFVRTTVRLARLRGMERRLAMSGDPVLQGIVASQCRRSGRHVLLLEGSPNEPPMTWGHFRPVLLLPSDAGAWQEGRLNSVLLHELAHIERGDWLASVVSQLACGIYWFNPLVWIIAGRMARESESAADDRVLGQGLSAPQYASHLLEVLRDLKGSRPAADVALAMARPGSLDGRVRAILEERRCRRPARGAAAMGLIASLAGIVVVIAAAGPTIVRDAALPDPSFADPSVNFNTVTPKLGAARHPVSPVHTVKKPMPSAHRTVVTNRAKQTATKTSMTSTNGSLVLQNGNHEVRIGNANHAAAATVGDLDGKVPTPDDINRIVNSALADGNKEMQAGLREAQEEVRKSMAEAQGEIEAAKKSGATKAQLEAAKNAMKFGASIANSTLKGIQPLLKMSINGAVKGIPNPKKLPVTGPENRKAPPSDKRQL